MNKPPCLWQTGGFLGGLFPTPLYHLGRLFPTPLYHLGRLFQTRLYHLGRLFQTRLYHLGDCSRRRSTAYIPVGGRLPGGLGGLPEQAAADS